MGEQVLGGRERSAVVAAELGLEAVVERIPGLLVPAQAVWLHPLTVGDGGLEVEPAVGVDGEPAPVLHEPEHGLEARHVLVEARASDLHLQMRVALVEVAAHLRDEPVGALVGVVVAARRVDLHVRVEATAVVAVGQQAIQGDAGELGRDVPDRDLHRRHGPAALAVPAGLLVLHDEIPDHGRVELAGVVEQAVRVGLQQPGDEAVAQDPGRRVAPDRVEPQADDGPAVDDAVGDDGHDRDRHLREVDQRVADRRLEPDRLLADLDDAGHRSSCRTAPTASATACPPKARSSSETTSVG